MPDCVAKTIVFFNNCEQRHWLSSRRNGCSSSRSCPCWFWGNNHLPQLRSVALHVGGVASEREEEGAKPRAEWPAAGTVRLRSFRVSLKANKNTQLNIQKKKKQNIEKAQNQNSNTPEQIAIGAFHQAEQLARPITLWPQATRWVELRCVAAAGTGKGLRGECAAGVR